MSPPLPAVVLADDAFERLVADIRDSRAEALVVMDLNTEAAAGNRVVAGLREADVGAEPLVFEVRSGLVAAPEAVERVRGELGDNQLAVAVGSGVITDIVRHASHELGRDFISVPTAASMDGYASGMAALERAGVKVTLPSRPPRAIYADPRVLAAAPVDLTRAGLGDLLAKATARVDWLAAHLLYGETYLPKVADRVLEPLQLASAHGEAALCGDVRAVREVLDGLLQSGIAMALAGSSRPASGFEHHASHFWDLLAARGLRPHHAHGLQVGYATRLAMALQRFAFAEGVGSLQRPRPPEHPLGPAARRWLGDPSPEILAAVEEKRRFAAELERWPADEAGWEEVKATLAPELARFSRVERALDRAGIPAHAAQLDLDPEMLGATLRHATRLRARYTVLDFLEGQGMLEHAIRALPE